MNITLKNVRLSFPSLFKTEVFDGKDTGKYGASFILDKDADKATIKSLRDSIAAAIEESGFRIKEDKICLKDGADSDYEGMENTFTLRASSNRRVAVVNRDKTPVYAEDDLIYAGCYVTAVISLWVQNNKFGKRINANLIAVQFVKDGEAFGTGPANVDSLFDDLDDADI